VLKGLGGVLLALCLATPCLAGDTFEPFISGVLHESRYLYDDWARRLLRTDLHGSLVLRQHGAPFQPENPGWATWFFPRRARRPQMGPMTQRHLGTVRSIANSVRWDLALEETVGFRHYRWTEANFLDFESELLQRLAQAQSDFFVQVYGFHEDRKPPTPYESESLTHQYLDIWVMAALLRVESDRYLEVYPLRTPHLERLVERQTEGVDQVADCRLAIVLMTDPNYRW